MKVRAIWRAAMALLLLAVLLSACGRSAPPAPPPPPPPAEVSDEATGYYCGMLLVDHPGPKGQIHLASRDTPLWFSSVRDTIAFLRLPEEARDVVAVYVNDMGKARDWDQPEAGTWVDAHAAWFVVDSAMRGGMGANEAVPFAVRADADAFRGRHGGHVVRLDDIPDDYVLGPVELAPPSDAGGGMPADAAGHEHPTDADGHPDH